MTFSGPSTDLGVVTDDSADRLLDQADLEDAVVHTATMTADGRVVVAGDSIRSSTCPITVVEADGTRTRPRDVPVASTCIHEVEAVGDQILVVDFASEEIRGAAVGGQRAGD